MPAGEELIRLYYWLKSDVPLSPRTSISPSLFQPPTCATFFMASFIKEISALAAEFLLGDHVIFYEQSRYVRVFLTRSICEYTYEEAIFGGTHDVHCHACV